MLALPAFHPASLVGQESHTPLPDSSREEGLFRKADLVYAAMFLGSLAAFYPLQEVEEELSPT
jgi:hypothetical protein